MLAASPVTIEIVASGAGPAEISLLAAGLTEAEYVGDPGAFAFQVTQEGDGRDNADAPPSVNMTVNNIVNSNNVKQSNLRTDHKDKVYSRSNGHLPQDKEGHLVKHHGFSASNGSLPNNQQPTSKNSNNKNFFLSRKNINTTGNTTSGTTAVSMSFLQSLDAKLQRLHDYRRSRHRRAAPDNAENTNTNNNNNNNHHIVQHPRPFMTVVRQGTFLKPPPELAALLGLSLATSAVSSTESSLNASQWSQHHPASSLNSSSMLYSFASRPRVLMQAHRHHCDAGLGAAPDSPAPGNAPGNAHARSKRAAPGSVSGQQDADEMDDGQLYSNLMFDRRVIRGNTFAHQPMPAGDAQDATAAALRQAEARRRALARRKAQLQQQQQQQGKSGRAGTPPPVPGRQHLDVQTDRYLEEIFDKPLESSVCCQTDLFAERPATPPFIPTSEGKDAETQIESGELFDFDEEVTPVLEVLVGRTVQQALVEVLEEEETAATQRQRARLEEVRTQQLEEQARLLEQERLVRMEKDRQLAEFAAARRTHQELEERVTATAISSEYLQQLLPGVLESLRPISEPVQQDVGEEFMPWLLSEVQDEMQKMMTRQDFISDIVREVLETRAELKRATADSPGQHGDDPASPQPTLTTGVVGEAGDAALPD